MVRILVTGATGFVGKNLIKHLYCKRFAISITSRKAQKTDNVVSKVFVWNYLTDPFPQAALDDVDVVIHLLGESISSFWWNEKKKAAIRDSRVESTKAIVTAIKNAQITPKLFISASAVGIYGDRGEQFLDEYSELGHDFLATVCREWEESSLELEALLRRVVLRFGVVMSPSGGFLKRFLSICKYGLTSPLGTGKQWMSYINLQDLLVLIEACIVDSEFSGVCNAVAKTPITNLALTQKVAKLVGRPVLPRIPAWLIKIVLGESAALILNSQRVVAARFPKGFTCSEDFLKDRT